MTKKELDKMTLTEKQTAAIDIYADIVADMNEEELNEFLIDN